MEDEQLIPLLQAQNRQLQSQNRQLTATVAQLSGQVERLTEEIRQLREQLDQAQRLAARQAAPFRRREVLKVSPASRKNPGRPKGHVGVRRPCPNHIDHTEVVALPCCPRCGGDVTDVRPVEQIIEEIPPVKPVVYRLITYRGTCRRCGRVCSRHPLQTSEGQGAAGVQLGPRALALAVVLNKAHGLTIRKTCTILRDLAGLQLSPGGLSQIADRVAARVHGDYRALQDRIRGSPAVFADETSWWVGGPGWWLWTFTTPEITVYRVDRSRGSAVVSEMLGDDFAGMLVSDCLSSYDPATMAKHKCIAHHLRAIGEALKLPGQTDPSYLHQWRMLFKTVIVVHRLWREGTLDASGLEAKRLCLEAWIDQLLAQPVGSPGDQRIRHRLAKQRPHLLGCLRQPAAEPTNNRAERALRPAVIARKLSCGNKTDRGRQTWQILASLGATCRQNHQDFIHYLAQRITLNYQG